MNYNKIIFSLVFILAILVNSSAFSYSRYHNVYYVLDYKYVDVRALEDQVNTRETYEVRDNDDEYYYGYTGANDSIDSSYAIETDYKSPYDYDQDNYYIYYIPDNYYYGYQESYAISGQENNYMKYILVRN